MVKPFGFRELVAAIRAVARRSTARPTRRRPRSARAISRSIGAPDASRSRAPSIPHAQGIRSARLLASDADAVHRREKSSSRCGTSTGTDRRRRSTSTLPRSARNWAIRVDRDRARCRLPPRSAVVGMTRRLLLSYLSITAFVLLILEIPLALTYEHSERDRLTADVERDARVPRRVSRARSRAGPRPTCNSSQMSTNRPSADGW